MWYEFDQNNSGGGFDVNDKLCHRVFIEAVSLDDAVEKAEDMGIYFDGIDKDIDCPCCGDRWSEPWEETIFPKEFDKGTFYETIEEYSQMLANRYGWTTPDIRLYYKDGEVKEIFKEAK